MITDLGSVFEEWEKYHRQLKMVLDYMDSFHEAVGYLSSWRVFLWAQKLNGAWSRLYDRVAALEFIAGDELECIVGDAKMVAAWTAADLAEAHERLRGVVRDGQAFAMCHLDYAQLIEPQLHQLEERLAAHEREQSTPIQVVDDLAQLPTAPAHVLKRKHRSVATGLITFSGKSQYTATL